uniref:Uncharacterized protein n=1 Tax=Glossina austeni TaxID=7395 RepID=A0A1A9VCW0_GLOAU
MSRAHLRALHTTIGNRSQSANLAQSTNDVMMAADDDGMADGMCFVVSIAAATAATTTPTGDGIVSFSNVCSNGRYHHHHRHHHHHHHHHYHHLRKLKKQVVAAQMIPGMVLSNAEGLPSEIASAGHNGWQHLF